MHTYHQKTGQIFLGDHLLAVGYSGHAEGKNNPTLQDHPRAGPLPRGRWLIKGPPQDTTTHGPYVMELVPEHGTETFGRSGFLIHGDSIGHPGEASLGCLIFPRPIREAIWLSGDYHLLCTE